jgi:hypothetical protein
MLEVVKMVCNSSSTLQLGVRPGPRDIYHVPPSRSISLFLFNLVDQGPDTMRDKDPKFVALLERPSRIGFPSNTWWCTTRQRDRYP